MKQSRASPGESVVKSPHAVQETQETWVQSLGWGEPLEKEMATHSSILAWEIPWTEEPGGLQSMRSQEVGLTEAAEQASRQNEHNPPMKATACTERLSF